MATDQSDQSATNGSSSSAQPSVALTGVTEIAGLRPARLSVTVMLGLVLIAAAVVASLTSTTGPVAGIVGASTGFAWAVHAVNQDRLILRVAGHFAIPATGVILLTMVLLATVSTAVSLPIVTACAYVALAAATFGAVLTYWGDIGNRELYRALRILPGTVVPAFLLVGLATWQSIDITAQTDAQRVFIQLWTTSIEIITTPTGGAALVVASLFGLLAVTALAVAIAIGTLPVIELAPRDMEETAETVVSKVRRALYLSVAIGITASMAAFVFSARLPRLLVRLCRIRVLRTLALALIVLSILTWVIVEFVNAAAGISRQYLVKRGLALGTGTLLTLITLFVAANPISELLRQRAPPIALRLLEPAVEVLSPKFLVLALLLGLLIVFVVMATVPVFLTGARFVPARTAGPALAGGGIATIGFLHGILGGSPLSVFGLFALGAIAWDTGAYAVTLGETIGRHATTRYTELVHLIVSVGSAIVAIAVAWAVLNVAGTLSRTPAPTIALVSGIVAFVLFAAYLRG